MRAMSIVLLVCCACSDAAPKHDTVQVPASYRAVRSSPEHVRHLEAGVACRDCHGTSGYTTPDKSSCIACHDRGGVEPHLAHTSTRAPGCFDCHSFGTERVAASDCLRCHSAAMGQTPKIQVHALTTCGQCHRPHQEPFADPGGCDTCHAWPARHGDQRGPAGCVTCHAPHEEKTAALTKCADCHRESAPKITTVIPKHEQCADCHRPHAVDSGGMVSCETCHKDQIVDHGRGSERCTDCHSPHAEPATPKTCTSCHVEHPSHAKGVACTDCHRPHQVKVASKTLPCAGCHDKMPVAAGHRDCLSCHVSVHQAGKVAARCDQCHAAVVATSPKGHSECASCHDVHDGSHRGSCVRCHDAEVRSPHLTAMRVAAGKPAECSQCHRPHGPDGGPPRCQSCHAGDELGALHRTSGHQECASCHGVHQTTPSDARATCLTCHTSQSTHEPAASRCGGCHPFAED